MSQEIKYNLAEKAVIFSIAIIAGLIALVASLLGASAICLAMDTSDSFSTIIAGICLGIGSLISGFLSGKKINSGGIINGLISGMCICLILFIISLFISGQNFSVVGFSHLMISLICSVIGGILGVNSNTRRKIL